MAQSGYTPILTYGSSGVGSTPLAANLTTSTNGVEMALNYTDGKLFYKDNTGTVQVLATKGAGTIGGSTTQVQYNSSGALAGSANLTFNGTNLGLGTSGAGSLFQGDFSNATLLNRTSFQTGTTNGTTGIYALPNGTSTAASWQATNAADPTNASKVLIATNGSTDVQLVSGINGTGTYLPLSLWNGGSGRFVIGTSGQFGIGPTASVSYGTSGQVLTSGGPSAAPTWTTVSSGSGTVNSGTQYQLTYYATTGTAVSGLGSTGTTGQVLTSQGSGAAPIWANASSGGTAIGLVRAIAINCIFP